MQDLLEAEHPDLHRYSETQGLPALIGAASRRCARATASLRTRRGARHRGRHRRARRGGRGCARPRRRGAGARALLAADPRDRAGLSRDAGRGALLRSRDSADAAVAAVRERIAPKTVALYVSTPSNPTGRVLPRAGSRRWRRCARSAGPVADLGRGLRGLRVPRRARLDRALRARAHADGLLVLEGLRHGGKSHRLSRRAAAAVAQALKISTHTFYARRRRPAGGPARAHGRRRLGRTRARDYPASASARGRALGIPAPEGGAFLFVDVSRKLDARGIWGFLEDCLDDGVALAPGPSCGEDYSGWVRLCYTAAPPDAVLAAARARQAAALNVAGR